MVCIQFSGILFDIMNTKYRNYELLVKKLHPLMLLAAWKLVYLVKTAHVWAWDIAVLKNLPERLVYVCQAYYVHRTLLNLLQA